MTVEMAISYANMLSYLSYKSGFCSVPVNVFNRMVEVQDLKAGVREDFNRNNTYRIIEKNNGEAEFSFLHGNNGDIKVLLDQLWNDLDFLFRTEHYVWSIEDMYHAIAFLCANEWTSILELSEEDMEERKELFSVRFEMIYGIPNDLTVLSDFTDRVSALAIYIAKYMTNTLSSVDENSKKGCYVTMKNYVDTIFGIIKKDFGNLPDASFKAMLPVILPLLFAVNYLDYDSDSDTVPYYFIASSINIGKYHLWRLKHANVACPICDAMDIAVRQIESVHCEAKVTYIDNRDYPLFYLTLLLNDLEQKDFNPFFSLAATIFQTLFDFWMQKYDIPSVLN